MKESSARAAAVLTIGRSIGFAATLAMPIVLARVLTQEEFGTYKYLFLIASTAGFMQLGVSESLYYFVPRWPERAGQAIANALAALAVSGAITAALLAAVAPRIAEWTSNPAVAEWLPLFGLFIGLMLISTPLEIVMVSRKRHLLAASTYALTDITRAALLLLPAIVSRSLTGLVLGAVAFAVGRVVATLVYTAREYGRHVRLDAEMWSRQWVYAWPFAIAVLIEVVQFNLHQYVVAARFDAATFAVYAVGCMQIPIVDLLATSTGNVMMVRLTEERRNGGSVLRIWHTAVLRLSLVFLPLVAVLVLTAREVIGVLYPPQYAAAAPIFMIAATLIAFSALPVDSLLRVFAATRFLIFMNLVRLAVVLTGIGWALGAFDLRGAILITVVAHAAAKGVALIRIQRLLGVGCAEVLPWRGLAPIALTAAVSVGPAWLVQSAFSGEVAFVRGAAAGIAYLLTFTALSFVVRSRDAVSPAVWLRSLVGRGN